MLIFSVQNQYLKRIDNYTVVEYTLDLIAHFDFLDELDDDEDVIEPNPEPLPEPEPPEEPQILVNPEETTNEKTVVFSRGNLVWTEVLDENNNCIVPIGVLSKPGLMYVSVYKIPLRPTIRVPVYINKTGGEICPIVPPIEDGGGNISSIDISTIRVMDNEEYEQLDNKDKKVLYFVKG